MECVRCGPINPPGSKRCDCGQTIRAPKENDWNERFGRAQLKPRCWRIAAGDIVIVEEIGQFFVSGSTGLCNRQIFFGAQELGSCRN
jgi:hypothetical protein